MNKQLTPQEVTFFFKREENDWQLVREASTCGDDQATLAMAMVRLINNEIDELWKDHDKIYSSKDFGRLPKRQELCGQITNRVGSLMKQRREILYNDYKIQDKRFRIYRDSLSRQMAGRSLKNVIGN